MGRVYRQCRRHRLPGRALPGRRLHATSPRSPPSTGTTTYKDTSVSASTSYSYRVRATDAAGNLSPYSNTVNATTPTPDTTPPDAAGDADRERRLERRGRPLLGRLHRQRRRHCLPHRALHGPRLRQAGERTALSQLQADRHRRGHQHQLQGHDRQPLPRPIATKSARPTLPATSAPTRTSPHATTPAGPSGLVAAYGFDEGSGPTVTDASGNGNNGSITNATWAASGKYGKALQFNGTNSLVTIPDSASLHLTTGMTLEAWVNPSTVNAHLARCDLQGQRQLLPRGNLDQRLESGRGHDRRRHVRRRLRHRPHCRPTPGPTSLRPTTGRRCASTSTGRR